MQATGSSEAEFKQTPRVVVVISLVLREDSLWVECLKTGNKGIKAFGPDTK